MKHYNVVAAVVCYEGKFLCMQKGKTKFEYISYKWEFPGGKIEPGETPQQALARELLEEMEYPVEVGEKLVTVNHEYSDFSITTFCLRRRRLLDMPVLSASIHSSEPTILLSFID